MYHGSGCYLEEKYYHTRQWEIPSYHHCARRYERIRTLRRLLSNGLTIHRRFR